MPKPGIRERGKKSEAEKKEKISVIRIPLESFHLGNAKNKLKLHSLLISNPQTSFSSVLIEYSIRGSMQEYGLRFDISKLTFIDGKDILGSDENQKHITNIILDIISSVMINYPDFFHTRIKATYNTWIRSKLPGNKNKGSEYTIIVNPD